MVIGIIIFRQIMMHIVVYAMYILILGQMKECDNL